uniref:Uncharacterized protein n=1 Tax=Panagrolaimus sp. ES5 TaxID=591445 RepID=A0AC34GR90_9BILA
MRFFMIIFIVVASLILLNYSTEAKPISDDDAVKLATKDMVKNLIELIKNLIEKGLKKIRTIIGIPERNSPISQFLNDTAGDIVTLNFSNTGIDEKAAVAIFEKVVDGIGIGEGVKATKSKNSTLPENIIELLERNASSPLIENEIIDNTVASNFSINGIDEKAADVAASTDSEKVEAGIEKGFGATESKKSTISYKIIELHVKVEDDFTNDHNAPKQTNISVVEKHNFGEDNGKSGEAEKAKSFITVPPTVMGM